MAAEFCLKFCRGKLLYFLDLEPYRSFEYGNLSDRRGMKEQWLQLDTVQKQRLFTLLQENAKEENRYYKYDFFYDNCATRIRDIVKESLFHQIAFDSTQLPLGLTMRDLLHQYLTTLPWTEFRNRPRAGYARRPPRRAGSLYVLPDYVHDMFAAAKLQRRPRWSAEIFTRNNLFLRRVETRFLKDPCS
ncbi:MAG: DUF4105 domain-containing protein [Lewinellaceae bacterium]|nr:DUF4105 domain-containing protein [Lewinellaceae bacterium]